MLPTLLALLIRVAAAITPDAAVIARPQAMICNEWTEYGVNCSRLKWVLPGSSRCNRRVTLKPKLCENGERHIWCGKMIRLHPAEFASSRLFVREDHAFCSKKKRLERLGLGNTPSVASEYAARSIAPVRPDGGQSN